MREYRGRKQDIEIKERINKLVIAGYSFQQIADTLGLKSRQLARYHWRKLKGLDKQKVKEQNV
jgi:hypothetical protein